MSSQYGELRPTSGRDLLASLGHPCKFQRVSRLGSVSAHDTLVVGVSQTLRRWTEGATYIRQGGHHAGHWPTFVVVSSFLKTTLVRAFRKFMTCTYCVVVKRDRLYVCYGPTCTLFIMFMLHSAFTSTVFCIFVVRCVSMLPLHRWVNIYI